MNNSIQELLAGVDDSGTAVTTTTSVTKRPTWAQAEGSPLPLGVIWIEDEQAFNFAVQSEHAESVTLLLYSSTDLVNPLLTYRFDFLRNKSGQIWHCRVPLSRIGGCAYYAYSVSGQTASSIHSFDPQKVLLDPYARGVFSRPSSIALWQCEKEQTQAAHHWAC